ncbi:MAG: ABC transporter permease [Gemmatimonadota bacterium]
MRQFILDLKLVIRSLSRRPGFCAVVILTLALGIGATSAIFSVVNAVLLKPLPYRSPEQLTLIWSRWINFDKTWLSEAEFLDYERLSRVFTGASAWGDNGEVALTGAEGPESVPAMQMTANLLDIVGMTPAAGRSFSAAEDIPNGPPVVMITYELWQRRFGGTPSAVGKIIDIDGTPEQVVGVMPKGFRFPLEFQSRIVAGVIQPLQINRSAPVRGSHGLYAVARMQPGVTAAAVTDELHALVRRWEEQKLYPPDMHFTAFATPLIQEVTGSARKALVVLGVAVALLLLLTCANVANLILARADGRTREVAVRAALGAGWREILRLALTESLLLSTIGAAAGLGLAWAGVHLLVSQAPTTIPRLAEVSVNLPVLGFTLLLAVVTGIGFGMIPAFSVSSIPLSQALREGSRGQSGGPGQRRGRTLLVVAEMGLAVLLVIGAGLTVRSLIKLMDIDPGFDARNTLSLHLSLPRREYPTDASVVAFYQELGTEVKELPGVVAAGFVRLLPLATEMGDAGVQVEERPRGPNETNLSADWQTVTPGWLEAMRIKLIRGRVIDSTDTQDGAQVIMINEAFAREYFPGEDPLGKRIRMGQDSTPWRAVVGVVGDVHHNGLTTPVKRAFFVPHTQWANSWGTARRSMTLTVRTRDDPQSILPAITAAVHRRDPNLTISQIATLDQVVTDATREQRFTMALMSGFAILALVLAAVGIYGVISYAVNQRTREIGIRLALGAEASGVRMLVLRQGMMPAVIGVGVGVALAALLSGFLRSMLYEIAPIDPVTFGTIPLLLLAVAAGAVLIPAVRASRVEVTEILKGE